MNIITMDRKTNYEIRIPGQIYAEWSDWGWELQCTYEMIGKDFSVTIITGCFDQAALIGLVRQLYNLGLPLLSIICLDM